ncbi:Transcriptional enhancer factor TEF-1, partial [Dissostichus eleginoides]
MLDLLSDKEALFASSARLKTGTVQQRLAAVILSVSPGRLRKGAEGQIGFLTERGIHYLGKVWRKLSHHLFVGLLLECLQHVADPPESLRFRREFSRNELIARYIKLRTGKTRTRKQVSSHIQVLARRKSREFHSKLKDQAVKDKALQSMASMSSAQIVSATAIHNKLGLPGLPRPAFPGAGLWQGMISAGQPGSSQDIKPFTQQAYPIQPVTTTISSYEPTSAPAPTAPAWQGRSIGTSKLHLVEFSAFLEQQRDQDPYNKHLFVHIGQTNHSYSDALLESVDIRQIYDKFPEKKGGLKELYGKGPQNSFFLIKFWADLNCNIQDETGSFYGVSSQYESSENMTITCSTKVCSFGKQVVEKVETEYARFENGRFVYRISRSPMCEYMINFIHKLKHLPEKYMMNSVLENFTILL